MSLVVVGRCLLLVAYCLQLMLLRGGCLLVVVGVCCWSVSVAASCFLCAVRRRVLLVGCRSGFVCALVCCYMQLFVDVVCVVCCFRCGVVFAYVRCPLHVVGICDSLSGVLCRALLLVASCCSSLMLCLFVVGVVCIGAGCLFLVVVVCRLLLLLIVICYLLIGVCVLVLRYGRRFLLDCMLFVDLCCCLVLCV